MTLCSFTARVALILPVRLPLLRGHGQAVIEMLVFPTGGDPGASYDSITRRLFALPDETVVLPGHDYKGNTATTIGAICCQWC